MGSVGKILTGLIALGTVIAGVIATRNDNQPKEHKSDDKNIKPQPDECRRYDDDGFDKDGFNKYGIDRAGYNRSGYDKYGYNRLGFDKDGYGRDKYNSSGIDRAGWDRPKYKERIRWLKSNLTTASKNLDKSKQIKDEKKKDDNYAHVICDARRVFEELLKLIVSHSFGKDSLGSSMLQNLNICYTYELLKDDNILIDIDKLHEARKIFKEAHETYNLNPNIHNKLFWAIKQVEGLLEFAEKNLIFNENFIS